MPGVSSSIRGTTGLRGFSQGGVVHYVQEDEWLYCSLLCFTEANRIEIDAVEESTAFVTCINCIAINGSH